MPLVNRITAPKEVHILVPGTREYVTLQERDFVIEYPGLSRWVQCNDRVVRRGRQGDHDEGSCDAGNSP